MSDRDKRTGSSLPAAGAPNPQGKGLAGFLQDWDYTRPRGIVARPAGQLLADYFTALLVLSADFRFRPAYGQTYHLYRHDGGWQLSLVSPREWGNDDRRHRYVGACQLHDDSTWTIEPSDNLGRPGPVSDGLAEIYDGFMERLQRTRPLEDELPGYEAHLPYYPRLFAAALSRSMKKLLVAGGQTGKSSEKWLSRLPRDVTRLLVNGRG